MGIVEDRSGLDRDRSGSGGQVRIRRTGQDQEDVLGEGEWNMGRVEWTARWTKDLMDSVWTGGLCVDRWNSAVARRQPYLWRYGTVFV